MDEPMIVQYGRYIFDVIRGDLGPSFRYKTTTSTTTLHRVSRTPCFLGVYRLRIAVLLGVTVGMISALRRNRFADYASMSVAVIGISRCPSS